MRQRAFTLVELLAVLFIISVASTLILLNISTTRLRPHNLESLTEHLQSSIELIQEKAIIKPALLGLALAKNRYAFLEFVINAKGEGKWYLLSSRAFQPVTLPDNAMLLLEINGAIASLPMTLPREPQILFDQSGDVNPFKIDIISKENNIYYRVEMTSTGNVLSTHVGAKNV